MDKIKKMILCHVPITKCNLKCEYCYISHRPTTSDLSPDKFRYKPDFIRKALSKERLGGVCYINLCADGETLLSEEVIDLSKELLDEGHYVEIVTNGTLTKRIDAILGLPKNLLERLSFKVSFHYKELIRLNMMDIFFDNFNKIINSGASAYLEMCADDQLLEIKEDIKKLCYEKAGACTHLTILRDDQDPLIPVMSKYDLEEYEYLWKSYDCDMLNFKASTYNVKRNEFCYAGEWSFNLDLSNGFAQQCYCNNIGMNIFDDLSKPIKLCAVGNNCQVAHCYNSHSFLAWGLIPELKTPTYNDMRQRNKMNGYRNWVNEKTEYFYSSKLQESNRLFTPNEMRKINKINEQFIHGANTPITKFKYNLFSVYQSIKINNKKSYIEKSNMNHIKNLSQKSVEARKSGRIAWIINTPLHGNLGDHTIVKSQIEYLTNIGFENRIFEINENYYKNYNCDIEKMIDDNDVIIIDGGGNLGTTWIHENNAILKIVDQFKKNQIVIFPQTISYSDNEYGENIKNITKETFEKHENLTLFVREKSSYEIAKNSFDIDVFLVPDIVLYSKVIKSKGRSETIKLCLREDKEKTLSQNKRAELIRYLDESDYTIERISTVTQEVVDEFNRDSKIDELLAEFSNSKLVITDRLHGMIFAYLTNTPCIALDNSTGKVKGVYEWLNASDKILFVESIDTKDIDSMLLKNKEIEFELDKARFKQIENVIKKERDKNA